ncbi:MAG: hypothetical protein KGY70_15080, partial [Bacteroidales bacterium]|nr:hypothetical protein [Bacteroidales bacterium]
MKKIFDFIKKIIRAILKFLGIIKDKHGPGEPKPPKESGFRELPDGTKLPEPYDGEEVKRLIHSVQSVSDEDERFVYDTV